MYPSTKDYQHFNWSKNTEPGLPNLPHAPTSLTQRPELIATLTERDNDGTRNAVGHDDCEHTQHPGVHRSKLIFKCLLLGTNPKHPKLSSHSISVSGVKNRFTKVTIHLLLFSTNERSVIFLRSINDVIR